MVWERKDTGDGRMIVHNALIVIVLVVLDPPPTSWFFDVDSELPPFRWSITMRRAAQAFPIARI